jgi:hypothetical protein
MICASLSAIFLAEGASANPAENPASETAGHPAAGLGSLAGFRKRNKKRESVGTGRRK